MASATFFPFFTKLQFFVFFFLVSWVVSATPPPPAKSPIPDHRLWNRGTRPHGLLPPRRARHLSPGPGADSACPFVLLRTPAAPGQSRCAESFPRFGPNYSRPDRRFRLQTQPGADPAGRGARL